MIDCGDAIDDDEEGGESSINIGVDDNSRTFGVTELKAVEGVDSCDVVDVDNGGDSGTGCVIEMEGNAGIDCDDAIDGNCGLYSGGLTSK